MTASLQDVKKGSLVHTFITAGKPGLCELCNKEVQKLEAHHLSYSPEITIKICHDCHHKVHFWPNRLNNLQKLQLLKKKFDRSTALKLAFENNLGIHALAKLIAPSRSAFVKKQQELEIIRIRPSPETRHAEKQKQLSKLHHTKIYKPKPPLNIEKKPAPASSGRG